MYQEKEPFNTAIYCTKCSVPLYLVNTHYISMVQEIKPVMLCSKCFAGLAKEDAEPVFDRAPVAPVEVVEVECPPAKKKPLWETMLEVEQRQREMERTGYSEHGVNMRPWEDTTGGR